MGIKWSQFLGNVWIDFKLLCSNIERLKFKFSGQSNHLFLILSTVRILKVFGYKILNANNKVFKVITLVDRQTAENQAVGNFCWGVLMSDSVFK